MPFDPKAFVAEGVFSGKVSLCPLVVGRRIRLDVQCKSEMSASDSPEGFHRKLTVADGRTVVVKAPFECLDSGRNVPASDKPTRTDLVIVATVRLRDPK